MGLFGTLSESTGVVVDIKLGDDSADSLALRVAEAENEPEVGDVNGSIL